MITLETVDSHTGGEPTRVVVAGFPDLGSGGQKERRTIFREQFDRYRSAIVNEPRGSDVLVGALLQAPVDPACVAGVIFFNNIGTISMCGHGMIGLVVTLGHLGRISAGRHSIETPVGVVTVEYDGANGVAIENVPSYRFAKSATVQVPGYGTIGGDIAWGGNWFYLINDHRETIDISNVTRLLDFTLQIRTAMRSQGVTGADGEEIDHIELFAPAKSPENHSRNFVLCPGGAYDRSPCGTGTSAKLACLYADGKLQPGEVWRQESVLGSVFEGSVRLEGDQIIPRIAGEAFVTAQSKLFLDDRDPFQWGIRG